MRVLGPNFKRTVDGIGGLALVIVQDAKTLRVLMVAFTDEVGFRESLRVGKVALYSTSRKKSWVKGEESGNFMQIVSVRVDCDGDAILYLVEPQGPGLACHTNAKSCFYRDIFGRSESAPDAGEHEALKFIGLEVHQDIQ
ncbi:hypothetical protein A3D70_00195 [Candidatus Adlerbacteria bacterium RIFCSPHIGHO2_02_FULL_54_18]|uniref:phosphoribosyl-AMP cyclohydrolase n=2 Tax=Candidatus Adleribacteriota TaxID=1752736 RepID=A0A1F4Y4F3_9BACT|nr:MAG: hypothetical protein A2949_02590 [Candidatus Adlerbacteria bacterium RIFCSPLOWO2_01_FULL_54_21b]OGC88840.1 MAG: hypothetical protein A3D70_00195 [Candidatus Adlerbacteria bacterium RIFCSPHIGHO2_02_FULL_54_18]